MYILIWYLLSYCDINCPYYSSGDTEWGHDQISSIRLNHRMGYSTQSTALNRDEYSILLHLQKSHQNKIKRVRLPLHNSFSHSEMWRHPLLHGFLKLKWHWLGWILWEITIAKRFVVKNLVFGMLTIHLQCNCFRNKMSQAMFQC